MHQACLQGRSLFSSRGTSRATVFRPPVHLGLVARFPGGFRVRGQNGQEDGYLICRHLQVPDTYALNISGSSTDQCSNKVPVPEPRVLNHVNDRRELRQSYDTGLMSRFTSLFFANDKPTRAPGGLSLAYVRLGCP